MKHILTIIIALLFLSCDSETGTNVNSLAGELSGRVLLFTNKGILSTERSGVLISFGGTNKSTTTDYEGKWTIKDLPAGTYTIGFQKEGYGEIKIFGYQFVGGGIAYLGDQILSQAPSSVIDFKVFYFYQTNRFTIALSGILPKPQKSRSVIICLSTDSTKLLGDASLAELIIPTSISAADTSGYFGQGTGVYDPLSQEFFSGKAPGTIVYSTLRILAEGENYAFFSNYYDPILEKKIYTAAGPPSQILKDTIP